MKLSQRSPLKRTNGFTLVEIMVAMVLTAFVTAAVYKSFASYQQIYTIQDQTVEMQQSVRAALEVMAKEIRSVGYDPSGAAGADFISATGSSLNFTMDLNGDGDLTDTGENVRYAVYTDDHGDKQLGRSVPAENNTWSTQSIGQNIENIEFLYILDDGTQKTAPAASELARIRCIQVTLLGRASIRDKNFIKNETFTTPAGVTWGPYSDGYRRRLITTAAKCRNMEFK